jgi:hypothetical protein
MNDDTTRLIEVILRILKFAISQFEGLKKQDK